MSSLFTQDRSDVTVFNAPRGWALISILARWTVFSLFVGALLEYGRGLPPVFLAASAWAVLMGSLWLRGAYEVAIGPEFIAVRSWWDILRRRPRSNEFVAADDVWLVCRRRGTWLLRTGRRVVDLGTGDWRDLAQAVESAGLKVTDRRTVWERQHRLLYRAEQLALLLALILMACNLPAEMLGYPDLIWLLIPAAFAAWAFSWAIVRYSSLPQPGAGEASPTATP